MRTWLRSAVNAILGKVPGKTSRLDTATRMAIDADFSYRREPRPPLPKERERDDRHLVKQAEPLPDLDQIEELAHIVGEAQERDADDEWRLDHLMPGDGASSYQRRRPHRR
jgi:hypothetical protein